MMSGLVRNLLLMLADAVCVGVCWLFSVLAYHACGGSYEPAFYLRMWPVIPAFLSVNVLFRLYHGRLFYPGVPFSPVEEMRRLLGSAVLVHLCVIAVLVLMHQTTEGYSRFVIILSGLLTAMLAQPMRDIIRGLMKRCSFGQIPVVLVGGARELGRLEKTLANDAYLGFDPVGSFVSTKVDEILQAARLNGVRVLLASEDVRLFQCHFKPFSEWFTHIAYFPQDAVFPVSGSRTVMLDGVGGIEMVNQARMPALRLEKWLLDKVLSVLLFVLSLPLLAVIGTLVMLTSRGGAFFRHERLGKDGKSIRIWKFRTMYRDSAERLQRILAEDPRAKKEWNENFKLKNDPRVTPLGRFLRRTSLDELPQLFNVLGGSMALVGPRPIVEAEKAYYGDGYDVFSSVKPGMTGLWQVSGRSETGYSRRVSLDAYYVLNWSPWMDLWILFRTVGAVLLLRGAR